MITRRTMRLSAACALLLALLAAPPTWAQGSADTQAGQHAAQPGASFAGGDRLALRWELQRTLFSQQAPGGRTQARLALANHDSRPLPAQGWSLYLNFMDGVETGPLAGKVILEQVAGNLFRLRPAPDFPGLAPGQRLNIVYYHPHPVVKLARAPIGPYLVYDADPERAMAVADFELLPVARPGQLDGGAGGAAPLVTAQDTYRRNAGADVLPAAQVPPVLPTPLQLQKGAGTLALHGVPTIEAAGTLANEAALARALLQANLPATLAAGGPPLRLAIGSVPGQASPEAYSLRIRADAGIDIVGNGAAGLAYGLQSLRELLPLPGAKGGAIGLPEVSIVDAPRFAYRGFQLDVARNFHGKETVFKWLDLMARFKMNTLHLHLTDDEGWRLEIAGLPELTSVGAVRGHSAKPLVRLQPAYGSGPDPRDPHGSGYYTRADYIEILRYARSRHIDVIPEIEMPGHARAAVQAMRARHARLQAQGREDAADFLLDDAADRSVYKSAQMYTDNVIDPGLDSTFHFIEHVVDQVAALHRAAGVPLHTIHMGGDELPTGAWEGSPASLARMKKEHLEGSADLWDYFYDRVDAILRRRGLATSGWEELAARKTSVAGRAKLIPNPRFTTRGFTAWVWNNTEGAEDFAYRLANGGYDIVLAPVTRMYMDMAYNANPEEPGQNWGGYVELDTVYDFIPLDYLKRASRAARAGKDRLSDDGKRRVRGLEATLFTETVRDPARIDYMAMPRLVAVAERAWAADPAWAIEADPARAEPLHRAAWSGFVNALGQRVLPRLDLDGSGVAYRIAPPGLRVEGGRVLVNYVMPGFVLRYTVDGSEPTAASKRVDGPIAERGLIRVAAFDRNGRRGLSASIEQR